MPKLLHERLRGLLPESVRSRIPERYQPPAWRAPVNPVPAAAKDETGSVAWALGDTAELSTDFTATLDAKEKTLHPPVQLPQGTVGRVVALGPDFVVLSVDGAPGVRVPKTVVVNLDEPSDARWARVAAPEEWQLTPEGESYPNEQQVLVEPKREPKPLDALGIEPDAGLENILRVYREATPEEAEYWGKWYHNAQSDVEALAAHYGLPFEQVAAVVAALSPGNKWAGNLRAADDVLSGNYRTNAYPNALVKARQILETGDTSIIQTPKVWVFYQSLLDPDAVSAQMVLDGHAINIWRGAKTPLKGLKAPTTAERAQMLADYQRAAETLGVPVQAVQATTWYIWKYTAGGRTARIAFPAKEKAWQTLLEESGISYPPDFTAADAAYKRWKQQYAKYRHSPRPVYEGGELDAVNQALSLEGDARVSGLFEGFERLTRNVRDWQDPALERAIEILRDVPGLETLRLPEFVMERELEDAEAAHWRRLEEEHEQEQEYNAALRIGAQDVLPPVRVGASLWRVRSLPTARDPWASWTTYGGGREFADVIAVGVAGDRLGRWWTARQRGMDSVWREEGQASTVEEAQAAALTALNARRSTEGLSPVPAPPAASTTTTDDLRAQERADMTVRRQQQEKERAQLPTSGWYPDLFLGPGEARGSGGEENVVSDDGTIVHYASPDLSWHRFVYRADGEIVSGLSLRATRPRGGVQTATIDRVCTKPEHQRQGYAAALMSAAREYFRKVLHSKDLTNDGKAWKRRVGAQDVLPPDADAAKSQIFELQIPLSNLYMLNRWGHPLSPARIDYQLEHAAEMPPIRVTLGTSYEVENPDYVHSDDPQIYSEYEPAPPFQPTLDATHPAYMLSDGHHRTRALQQLNERYVNAIVEVPEIPYYLRGEARARYERELQEALTKLLRVTKHAGVVRVAADGIPASHTSWREMPIAIEVPGGGVRFPGGEFETFVPAEWVGYGYFEGLPAEDGDSLDVVLGPDFGPEVEPVYLATQCSAEDGDFRQFKVMLGFESALAAEAAFKILWPASMFGGLTEVPAVPFERAVLPKIVVEAPGPETVTVTASETIRVAADADFDRMTADWADLYARVKAAGAPSSGLGLALGSKDGVTQYLPGLLGLQRAFERGLAYGAEQGETREQSLAEFQAHLDTLRAQAAAFIAEAPKHQEERRREREDARLESLGDHLEDDVRRGIPAGERVWLYHVTSSTLLPEIMKHGLLASPKKRTQVGPGASRERGVYLHTSGTGVEMDTYGRAAVAAHGGRPVLLRVLVDSDDLEPDPDDADLGSGGRQVLYRSDIPPSDIYQVDGAWTDTARAQPKPRRRRGARLRIGAPARVVVGAPRAPHVDESVGPAAAQVALRAVRDETEKASETVQLTLVSAVGPESWDLHVMTGLMPMLDAPAGRIILGDVQRPDAVLSWATEHSKPYVHNVWVADDLRGKGVARILYDAYRRHVAAHAVTVGPFSPAGYGMAQSLSDQVSRDPPKSWRTKKESVLVKKRPRIEYDDICPHCDEVVREKSVYMVPPDFETMKHSCGGIIELKTPEEREATRAAFEALYPSLRTAAEPWDIQALGNGTYTVRVDGREVARADVVEDGKGDYLTSVHVEDDYKRQGIATALYDFIEADLGRSLRPSPTYQTPDAQAFWRSRSKREASVFSAEAYHFTNAEPFSRFDPARIGTATDAGKLGAGFYVTTDGRPHPSNRGLTRLRVRVQLNNPLRLSMTAWSTSKTDLVCAALGLPPGLEGASLTSAVQAAGYDGVVLDYSAIGYAAQEICAYEADALSVLETTRVQAAASALSAVEEETGDVVVTLPKSFGLEAWMAEGDAPGSAPTGQEYAFHCGGRPPRRTVPGDRVYVVHDGRLIGYAPLVRIDVDQDGRGFSFIRGGGAVACTLDMELPGFRGYRYRTWDRADERQLHQALVVTAGVTLTRTGYQRYSGVLPDGRRVWVGCESRVSHGTYPAGRRQKRESVWLVRVDGVDLGEGRTFAEARALLERAASEVRVAFEAEAVTVTARMRAKDTPGASACIVIPVPESLAKMWPDARGEHDSSPPHITVLYLGEAAADRLEEARELLGTVAAEFKPIPVEFAKGTSWFTNDEGLQIAHKAMHPKTEERLQALHAALREAFTAAGFEIQHRDGFTGHATLGYFETQEPVRGPEGGFSARTLELWGWPEDVVVTLGARTARRRRKNKRRRYIAEIYYRRPGEDIAYTTRAVAGASAVEVRLRPGARIMRGESLALIERARLFGYDAVRRADQLVILNEEVLCAS